MNSIIKNFSDWSRLFEEDSAQPSAAPATAQQTTAPAQPAGTAPAAKPAGSAAAPARTGSVMLIQGRTDVTKHTPELAAKLGGKLNTRYTIESKSGSFLRDFNNMSKSAEGTPLQNFFKMTEAGTVAQGTDELTIGSKSVNGVGAVGQFTVLSTDLTGPITASGNGLLAFARIATGMRRCRELAKNAALDFSTVSNYAMSFVLGAKADNDDSRGSKCAYLSLGNLADPLYTSSIGEITWNLSLSMLMQGKYQWKKPATENTKEEIQEVSINPSVTQYAAKDPYLKDDFAFIQALNGGDPIPKIATRIANGLRINGVLVNPTPDTAQASTDYATLKSPKYIINPSYRYASGQPLDPTPPSPFQNGDLRLTADACNLMVQIANSIVKSIKPVSLPEGFDDTAKPVFDTYTNLLERCLTSKRPDLFDTNFIKLQHPITWGPTVPSQPGVNSISDTNLPPGAF